MPAAVVRPVLLVIILSFFAMPLAAQSVPSPSTDTPRAARKTDSQSVERFGKQLVEAIRDEDPAAFARLLPTWPEWRELARNHLDADMRDKVTEEWAAEDRETTIDDFRWGLDYAKTKWPVVDLDRLRFAGARIATLDRQSVFPSGTRFAVIEVDVPYAGLGALRFQMVAEVARTDRGYIIAYFELFLEEIPSKPLDRFLDDLLTAVIRDNEGDFRKLLPEPADMLWHADNRMPVEDRANFRDDWKNIYGSPTSFNHDIAPFRNTVSELRSELGGEPRDITVRSYTIGELEDPDLFRTHILEVQADVALGGGKVVPVEFWIEAAQGRRQLFAVGEAIDFGVVGKRPDWATAPPAKVEEPADTEKDPCEMARFPALTAKIYVENGRYDEAIAKGGEFMPCLASMKPDRALEGACTIGRAHYLRYSEAAGSSNSAADPSDLIRAAGAYEAGFQNAYAQGLEPYQIGSAVRANQINMAGLATTSFNLAASRYNDGTGIEELTGLFQAVQHSGYWLLDYFPDYRPIVAESGYLIGSHFYNAQQFPEALDAFERAVPVTEEALSLPVDTLVARIGIRANKCFIMYRGIGVMLFNQSVPVVNELREATIPDENRKALVSFWIDRASIALGLAERLKPGDGKVSEARGLVAKVRNILSAL